MECTTDCLTCKNYYRCESPMRLSEEDRDFWLDEREEVEEQ